MVFHNTSKFLPRAVSGFHMNQSIHVPVFLPNLHSQPSGKLNFTHLDPLRTLAFFWLLRFYFASRAQNYFGQCPDCPWLPLTVCEKALVDLQGHAMNQAGQHCLPVSELWWFLLSVDGAPFQNKTPTWPLVQTSAGCNTTLETSDSVGGLLEGGRSALCIGLTPSVMSPQEQPHHTFPTHLGQYLSTCCHVMLIV